MMITTAEQHFKLLCDSMFTDMEEVDRLYRPTTFWDRLSKKLAKSIIEEGIKSFRQNIHVCNMFVPSYGLSFMENGAEKIDQVKSVVCSKDGIKKNELFMEYLLDGEADALADYRVFLSSYKDTKPYYADISESKYGEPLNQHCWEGKCFSRSMLNYLLGINFLKQHCDTSEIEVVMEIGGGFGTLGEILHSDERNNAFYIDIDIPPVGPVASYYLKNVLGVDQCLDYLDLGKPLEYDIDEFKSKCKALVIPSWGIEKLEGAIDLFVNFISFQEMEPDVVINYVKHIQRLKPSYVLLRNMREGKNPAHVETPIFSDDYDRFFTEYRLVATNTIPFGYKTVDGFHSELKLYEKK